MDDWQRYTEIPANIGPYQVLGPLGSGSFSVVRLGLDPETKTYYAIKIVPKKCIIERGLESKFENEIRIVQQLRHPGVVQLIDLLKDDSNYYLVMEYCSNGDLYSLITNGTTVTTTSPCANSTPTNSNVNNSNSRSNYNNATSNPNSNNSQINLPEIHHLSEPEAKNYFRQIVDTLLYVHKQGVAHRDLKPENILIDSYGRLKLSDFGLSRFVGKDGLARTPCGSPCYAAPEVIRSGVDMSLAGSYSCYDGRKSDAWSCGVILYAMLTGYLPWTRFRNQASLFQQILDGDFVIPNHVSVQAAYLIRMLMDVIPEQRFSLNDVLASDWMKSTVPMLSPINKSNDEKKPFVINSASVTDSNNAASGSVVMIAQHGFSMNDIPKFGNNKFGVPPNPNDHNRVEYQSCRGPVSLRTVDRFFNRDNTDDENMFHSVDNEKEVLWRSSSASSRTIEGVMKAISTNKKLHMMHLLQHHHASLASASVLPSSSSKRNECSNASSLSSSSSSSPTKYRINIPSSSMNVTSDAVTTSSASSSSNSALTSAIQTPKGMEICVDCETITENSDISRRNETNTSLSHSIPPNSSLNVHNHNSSTKLTNSNSGVHSNSSTFNSHSTEINSNVNVFNSNPSSLNSHMLSFHSTDTSSNSPNNSSLSSHRFNIAPSHSTDINSNNYVINSNSNISESNSSTTIAHSCSPKMTTSMTKINSLHIQHSPCNSSGGILKKASVIANQPVIVSPDIGAQRQIKPVSFIP
ncbi:hypothetical protein M9Y10_012947 [Tritrichomonas musculus]|uniref:non-specific serine/threonine protein kinase n=1 Tax=Tritrichomonas musculus TaxID=1915356 RepID=A0ABR2I7J5_9EUKA